MNLLLVGDHAHALLEHAGVAYDADIGGMWIQWIDEEDNDMAVGAIAYHDAKRYPKT
jgi:hypothetical protein